LSSSRSTVLTKTRETLDLFRLKTFSSLKPPGLSFVRFLESRSRDEIHVRSFFFLKGR
jgi:hypothetical protein